MKKKIFIIAGLIIVFITIIIISLAQNEKDDDYRSNKSRKSNIYAALYRNGTLVFNSKDKFDDNKVIKEYGDINNYKDSRYGQYTPWQKDADRILQIEIVDEIYPESTRYWFFDCTKIETIDLKNINTSNTKDMGSMFWNCENLKEITLNSDSSKVTDMSYMFYGCKNLTKINFENFDTSRVTNMKSMFAYCESLKNLNIDYFDTSNVENMSGMFQACENIETLSLKYFDTSKVEDMGGMFAF